MTKTCKRCKKEAKHLFTFDGIKSCEQCCRELREHQDDKNQMMGRDGEIDFQREISEGCLDEYNY